MLLNSFIPLYQNKIIMEPKNIAMIFGASFFVTILAIHVGKPAFCCRESKETSGVKELKWGTVIGVAFSIGLIAVGIAFMMSKPGTATPVSTLSSPNKGFRFAFEDNRLPMPVSMRMNMDGDMSCGCGM